MTNSKTRYTILLSLFFLPLTLAAAADNLQADPDPGRFLHLVPTRTAVSTELPSVRLTSPVAPTSWT